MNMQQYYYFQQMRRQSTLRAAAAAGMNCLRNPYSKIGTVDGSGWFLNYVEYNPADISPDTANAYFKQFPQEQRLGGKCTGVHADDKVLRCLDWTYTDQVEFVVKMNADRSRGVYRSVGVTALNTKLTRESARDFIENGTYDDFFKILPYITVDGVNEMGIFAQSNVVNCNGVDRININEGASVECCCSTMLVRRILDKLGDLDRLDDLLADTHMYATSKVAGYNPHVMVADARGRTKIIEFENDRYVIKDFPIMTNFRTSGGFETGTNLAPVWNTVEYNGCGVERWELAAAFLSGDSRDFRRLRDELKYTRSYLSSYDGQTIRSAWLTESLSTNLSVMQARDYHDMTDDSPYKTAFDANLSAYYDMFKTRSRLSGETWQTSHACIYDLTGKSFNIQVQEGVNPDGSIRQFDWNVSLDGEISKNVF